LFLLLPNESFSTLAVHAADTLRDTKRRLCITPVVFEGLTGKETSRNFVCWEKNQIPDERTRSIDRAHLSETAEEYLSKQRLETRTFFFEV
jgi:hypothetical protein